MFSVAAATFRVPRLIGATGQIRRGKLDAAVLQPEHCWIEVGSFDVQQLHLHRLRQQHRLRRPRRLRGFAYGATPPLLYAVIAF
jgi:hypothetical protein